MSDRNRGHIRGLAFDTAWREVSRLRCVATVHSSFQHVINLEWRGRLLSLVAAEGKPAPGVLITDARRFSPILPGVEVIIGAGWVDAGDLQVSITDTVEFSCVASPPDVFSPASAAILRSELAAVSVTGSFLSSPHETPYSVAVRRRLEAGRDQWQRTLRNDDAARLSGDTSEVASRLVGLGWGLTPTGDDYLVGALAVLHHLPNDQCEQLTEALADAIDKRVHQTTDVSAHFLLAGLDGRFHADLRSAAISALTGSDLGTSFRRVRDFGSTSGFDTLVGLVDTLTTLPSRPGSPPKPTGPIPIFEGALS